jgi:hypothetical protein
MKARKGHTNNAKEGVALFWVPLVRQCNAHQPLRNGSKILTKIEVL